MSATSRNSSWIVTLSLAAIAAVYMTLMWLPGRRAVKESRQQVETKRQFVAQATGLSAALSGIQQQVDQAESVVTQWEKIAPCRRDIPTLYGKINALAKDAHLVTGRFDPQPLVVHEKLREIPLTMSCGGSFGQIYEFLRKVEGLPVTIWIESMRIEKSTQNKENKGDVQCELNLVVFSNNSQSSDYAKHFD